MKNILLGILLGLVLVGAVTIYGGPGLTKLRTEKSAIAGTSPSTDGAVVQVASNMPAGSPANLPAVEPAAPAQPQSAVGPVDGVQEARRHRHSRRRARSEPSEEKQSAGTQPYNIVINIPAFRLRMYESGKLIKVYPVCAGMPGYRSPVSSGVSIKSILWNPSWGPPPGAAWAKNSSAKGPGKWNPVGLVKMPIKGYVFVHGTYKIKSMGFPWSHGCFRMANEDAVELAWFLQSHVGSNQPDATLDTYRGNHRTSMVRLNHNVPVDIIYDTVEVYDGKLFVHPDVYRRGTTSEERVLAKINEAGWPTNNLNMEKIRWLIARSPIETAIAKKEDLVNK